MTAGPQQPPQPETVPYATPQRRKTPRWVWWAVGGACVVLLLVVLLPVLAALFYLQLQPQSSPPTATVEHTAATAPVATQPADGE